ncbi:MAG: DEAD/DEAH box helicase, partial [Opitutales bacterium]
SVGHAMVHGGRAKDDIYAVLEWPEGGKLSVRHSVSDRRQGRALAAAGLYEIEEFVVEEASPLPASEHASAKKKQPEPEAAAPAPDPPARPSEPPPRPLHLTLRSSSRGLQLGGHWVAAAGMEAKAEGETPAPRRNAFRGGGLTGAEREALIAVTTEARRAGFEPRWHSGDYILRDPDQIVAFAKRVLPRWRRRFQVEADAPVARLASGLREPALKLRLERRGRGLSIDWLGRLGTRPLDAETTRALLRQPGEAILHPEHGLLRLSREQAAWVTDWQPVLQDRFEGELPFYMLFSLRAQEEMPVLLGRELEAWQAEVEEGAKAAGADLPGILRAYQRTGVEWMRHLLEAGCHPLLADEMGLGKTLQILSLLATDPRTREGPSLIVCPASVLPVWEAEAARFFPHLELRRLQRGNAFEEPPGPVLWLASYTQLRRHRERLGERTFAYVVLDEAQVIKNPDARVAQACCAVQADRRLAMTGTPIENRPLDLWSIFRFLMPGLLGARRRFEDEFEADPGEALARLRRQILPFVLRRTKNEVGKELPEKIEIVLPCALSEVQVAEYQRLAEAGARELGEQTETALRARPLPLLSLLTRLRQTCCDPGLLPWREDDVSQSGKLVALCERLETIVESGGKAVIFSQFVRFLDRAGQILTERFPELHQHRLTGQTVDRAAPVEAFQTGEGPAVFLVSLKAGGAGITLHAADYVFLLDPWWNPAVEAQAIDRVHRLGQRKRVVVYRLVTRGTVEERIEALKAQKREQFDSVVGGMEGAVDWARQYHRLADLIAYRETA